MCISIATMGKFNYQYIKGGFIREEIEIKKPKIYVKYVNDIPLLEKMEKNIKIKNYKKPNIKIDLIEE